MYSIKKFSSCNHIPEQKHMWSKNLVVNKMADSVMTAPLVKSGIRFKKEIWTWAGMRTRIAQVAERRARNPEVRGSNPGSGSSFSLEIL